ncbi:MAG TPA: outer membrane beta-barrel protein [Terracidiphilus sp.]|nr:outer membrane beta-barrel protein [Terracidiphilus sp.]
MRISSISSVFLFLAALALTGVVAHAQTDIGLSVYGAFNGTSNGNGTAQSPANAAGGIVELRHISNPFVGYEATYSYNRANQSYRAFSTTCPVGSATPCPLHVSANAHEVTADWIASVHIANLRPFALAGVGLLLDVPAGNQSLTNTTAKPVFVYGAGLDWSLIAHLGLRFQYRGNLYKAPDLTTLYTSTNKFTHTAEPMIGAYLRF